MKKESFLSKYLPYILIAVLALLYYIANSRMYMYGDDLYYSTNIITGNDLTSLSDIYYGQIWHYDNWGGRTVAHSVLQLLFLAGNTVFDLTNVIVFLVYGFLANKLMSNRNGWTFIAILSATIAMNVTWLETMLWKTGIANYLFMTFLQVALLLLYDWEYSSENHKPRFWLILPIALLGLCTGWTNENMGPAVLLALIAYVIVMKVQKKQCPIWMYAGIVSCAIGCFLLITAPGNAVRSKEVEAEYGFDFFTTIIHRILSEGSALLVYLQLPLVFAILAVIIYKCVAKMKFDMTDYILLGISVLSWGAMIMVTHYPARASYGTMVFLSLFAIRLLSKSADAVPKKYLRIGASCLLLIAVEKIFIFYC